MIMDRITKLGMIFAGVGGIVALIGLPFSYTNDLDTFVPLGAFLLLATMFFAMCGAFSKNGQWTPIKELCRTNCSHMCVAIVGFHGNYQWL